MKYTILLGLAVLAGHTSFGQKTEYSAHLNSGFFAYRGANATANSAIVLSDVASVSSYTNNPYGTRMGLSDGLAGQLQRVTRGRSLFGIQAGYEVLRSRVKINEFLASERTAAPKKGHTNLVSRFVNVHPFAGHRFVVKAIDLDMTVGPEVGFLQSIYEKGKAETSSSDVIKTDRERYGPTVEVRARGNVTAYYRRVGLSAGYSYGLTNYRRGYVGSRTNDLFTQMIRVGAVYRFN